MPNAQSIFIVDSEPEGRMQLRQTLDRLRNVFPHHVVGEADSAQSALAQIGSLRPNVLLVNPALPDMNGIEFGRRLVDPAHRLTRDVRWPQAGHSKLAVPDAQAPPVPQLIYVSGSDRHALDAFEVSALDYLLKPVNADRLLKALARTASRSASGAGRVAEASGGSGTTGSVQSVSGVQSTAGPGNANPDTEAQASSAAPPSRPALLPGPPMPTLLPAAPQRTPARRHFAVHERGRLMLVPVEQVLYLKAELKYVTVRTRQREYLIEDSLTALESEFGDHFVRIHRNALVCRTAVAGFERVPSDGRGIGSEPHWQVVLRDVPERLPVSRRQWATVRNLMG
jgi:two-component system response regulator AlgR